MESLFLSIIVAKYLNVFPHANNRCSCEKKFFWQSDLLTPSLSARVHYRDLKHAYVTEFDCVALLAML